MATQKAPYGTWTSPITAEAIMKNAVQISDILVDPCTSAIYHLESRPAEGGRNILVNTATGHDVISDKNISDKKWDFRTAVHDYGGASTIVHNNLIYFSQYTDGMVYCLTEGCKPEAITPDTKVGDRYRYRYAAFAIHPVQTHLLVAILEDHTIDEPAKVVNTLCMINARTKTVKSVVIGADFYACPKFSPDGNQLGWQQWCHPDMPWEGAEVYIGNVVQSGPDDFSIKDGVSIAGKPNDISCGYLEWTSNDTLIFTSDESKYINPWKYANGTSGRLFSEPVPQDFGSPMWFLNIFPYTILDEEGKYALFIAINEGRDELQLVNLQSSAEPRRIATDYVVIGSLRSVCKKNQEVIFVGQKVDEAESIVRCTISTSGGSPQAIFPPLQSKATKETKSFPKEIISTPQPPFTVDGDQGKIHIIYYPPKNPQYSGSSIDGERPPCVVQVHGGPTGLQQQGLDWKVQYFTSRGWAWLSVNYGGSSGYGREYIKRLEHEWGHVDADDTISAVKSISSAPYKYLDPKRVCIRGGSSGGFTALCGLYRGSKSNTFAAANSSYGVSELLSLAATTHKFEMKYMLKLIGAKGTTSPEDIAIFKERSPVNHGDDILVPVQVLQGGKDEVVPKGQAEELVKAITKADIEYVVYHDEQHGWRQEKNMKDALEQEIGFYEKVLGLKGKSM